MYWSDRSIRRVLVALDSGPDYYEPLQRGAELARALGAELGVLFVEDVNLFRLCELASTQLTFGSRAWRPLEARTLEHELRARAAEARASLERIAQVAELAWSFQVWRGRTDEALREAARHADLVSLSRALRPLAASRRGGRRVSLSVSAAPVVALFEFEAEDRTAERVLDIAARLARTQAVPLLAIAPGPASAAKRRAQRAAEERLLEIGVTPLWRTVRQTRQSLVRSLRAANARLLVLGAHGPAVSGGLLNEMLLATGAQALLVGGPSADRPSTRPLEDHESA